MASGGAGGGGGGGAPSASGGALVVIVGLTGKTIQLDVEPGTRVDAVQAALVAFTGIPVSEQIAVASGARLDPSQPLAAYGLPPGTAAAADSSDPQDRPIFLYQRQYLRPGAEPPPVDPLPPVEPPPLSTLALDTTSTTATAAARAAVALAPKPPAGLPPHPLLDPRLGGALFAPRRVRALPKLERAFAAHVDEGRALWECGQARLQAARRLLSEGEAMARAADAARGNVEAHYRGAAKHYAAFAERFGRRHARHAALLADYERAEAALQGTELAPALRARLLVLAGQEQGKEERPGSAVPRVLADLVAIGGGGGGGGAASAAVDAAPPSPSASLPLSPSSAAASSSMAAASSAAPGPASSSTPTLLPELHAACKRAHERLGQRAAAAEASARALRSAVEALLVQPPPVDLDALGARLGDAEAEVDGTGSVVQVLAKDLRTAQALVEEAAAALGGGGGAGGGTDDDDDDDAGGGIEDDDADGNNLSSSDDDVEDYDDQPLIDPNACPATARRRRRRFRRRHRLLLDRCAAVASSVAAAHSSDLLPRARRADFLLNQLCADCHAAKSRMARDVAQQLQRVAAQQQAIRDLRSRLAALDESLSRHASAFSRLRAVHRLPAAYRLALAECARRAAWQRLFSAQAARLAEHMANARERECGRREAFLRRAAASAVVSAGSAGGGGAAAAAGTTPLAVADVLPASVLQAMGLLREAPHCEVRAPAEDPGLLPVSSAELRRLLLEELPPVGAKGREAAARVVGVAAATEAQQQDQKDNDEESAVALAAAAVAAASIAAEEDGGLVLFVPAAAEEEGEGEGGEGAAPEEKEADADALERLALENARLRADLAAAVATAAAREFDAVGRAAVAAGAGGDDDKASAAVAAAAAALRRAADEAIVAAAAAAASASSPAAAKDDDEGATATTTTTTTRRLREAVQQAELPSLADAVAAQGGSGDGQAAQESHDATLVATASTTASEALRAALAAKDGVVARLEEKARREAERAEAYARRVAELERALAEAAAGRGG